MEVPNWADVVKTGTYKELAPYDQDWFFVRCASMARKVYLKGPIGVGAFKKIHGGPSNRGVKPNHFKTASGSVARACLKQLEAIGVVSKHAQGGRIITPQGMRDLDRIAGRVAPPSAADAVADDE
jgi:small subunit ribosomal protein S19e